MTVADHARDFPLIADIPPEMDELETAAIRFSVLHVAELMRSELDRAEILDRMDTQRSRQKVSLDAIVAAEHSAESCVDVGVRLQSTLVFIELHVTGEKIHQRGQVMRVERSSQRRVLSGDGLIQRGRRRLAGGLRRSSGDVRSGSAPGGNQGGDDDLRESHTGDNGNDACAVSLTSAWR